MTCHGLHEQGGLEGPRSIRVRQREEARLGEGVVEGAIVGAGCVQRFTRGEETESERFHLSGYGQRDAGADIGTEHHHVAGFSDRCRQALGYFADLLDRLVPAVVRVV